MRTNSRRPAITLLEVLAAIFIMGVGMLAILVLFPLGALNMARALRDDRLGHIAYAADSLATAREMRYDPTIAPPGVVPSMTTAPAGLLPPDPAGPSYPVFVDPYYRELGNLTTLSNIPGVAIPRVSMPWISSLAPPLKQYTIDRNFSLQDDLTFDPDGKPKNAGALERQGYYTWAYLFRRSTTSLPKTTEMYVVVYSGRPVLVPQPEPWFDVDQTTPPPPGATTFVLNQNAVTGALPQLRRGNWLLDVSYKPSVTNPANGRINAFFYRVLEATKLGANQVQVDVEPPLKNDVNYPLTRVVVLENAIEVFDRGTGR